jgi:hypothetical protein
MSVQPRERNSLEGLNPHCLNNLVDFCSLKDRAHLRVGSRQFRSEIAPFPQEAKPFFQFESKLPLVREILRVSELYSLLQIPGLIEIREERNWHWVDITTKSLVILSGFLLYSGQDMTRWDAKTSDSAGGMLMLMGASIIVSYIQPRIVNYMNGNIDHSVELRGLWYEYQNGEIPEDLIAARDRLNLEFQQHEREKVRWF